MRVTSAFARAATVALLVGAPALGHAQTISNLGSFNAAQSIEPFGAPATATYGQTFTAPAAYLYDFSFWLRNYDNGGALLFNAYIGLWNGNNVVGSPLWSGGPFAGTNSATPLQYQFNTGGIAVVPGQQYLAFLNASAFIVANPNALDFLRFSTAPAASLAGGFEYLNNNSNFAAINSPSGWNTGGDFGKDLIFVANFSPNGPSLIPEPATMTLMATGLVGLMAARRRKKR